LIIHETQNNCRLFGLLREKMNSCGLFWLSRETQK